MGSNCGKRTSSSCWVTLCLAVVVTLSPCHLVTLSSARADPGSVEDVQDVLFFHQKRPVLIRLHVFVDGKPYPARWTAYLTRWFRFLDRDEDGFLDRLEAARAPAARVLEQLLSNPFTYETAAAPDFEDFDRDRDKKVSLDEFLHYYRQSMAGPVYLAPAFNQYVSSIPQNALTEALYTLLDKDRDGKLSRSELENAAAVLHKFDGDDDELLTLQELQEAVPPPPVAIASSVRPLTPALQAPDVPLLLVPREDAPRRLDARLLVAREVMKHYDKNKNKSLSRAEIGMAKELFDRLDADKDGELDLFELLRWMIAAPDAEIVVRLGRVGDEQEAIEASGAKNPALGRKARNALAYSTVDHSVNFLAAASVPPQDLRPARRVIVRQFQTIDQKGKGFLTKKQLRMPQFYYLHAILPVADRAGDECLDLEDLNDWLDLTTSGLHCQISVALAASGRGLFSILDADQDGRLSLRELHSVWKRLAVHDQNHDGAISREEIPLQYQVVVTPGAPNYRAGQFSGIQSPPDTTPASARGPLWFRKMDRNGDGDVSPREFLGSRDDFRRLDTDGDGVISEDEARRADAVLRKK
jgi:Ca2+-binding EF-hand superfamily protein